MAECTCPPDTFSATCPWARAFTPDHEPLGHVRSCPITREPCPCLDGSTAQAYCYIQAREETPEELENIRSVMRRGLLASAPLQRKED